MKLAHTLSLLLLLILLIAGCCTPTGHVQLTPPPQLAPSVEPRAIANRIFTSLFMLSPIATNQPPTRVHVASLDAGDSPAVAEALDILRGNLRPHPLVTLVGPDQAAYRIVPGIEGEGATAALILRMYATGDETILWRHREALQQ